MAAKTNEHEQLIAGLKKTIALLDEKIKAMGKAAALSGNTGMAGNLLEDMEKEIAKLREDLTKLKGDFERNAGKVKEQIDQKADRSELIDLEGRMMQRLQDMFDQMRGMFQEKEPLKKKLATIEKNVSTPPASARVAV